MRLWVSAGIVCIVALVQSTWLPRFALGGIGPDLVLVALAGVAYRHTPLKAQAVGLVVGVLEDAMSLAPLGFNALVRSFEALSVASLAQRMHKDRFLYPVLLVLVAQSARALGVLVLSLIVGRLGMTVAGGRAGVLALRLLFNACVAPLVFLAIGKVSHADVHVPRSRW